MFYQMEGHQVILEISDFFKFFFVNPRFIFGYLNDVFEKKYNSTLYIEDIENGVLFVFKDFDSMKIRAEPLKKSDLKEIKSDNSSESNFFHQFLIPKEKFPIEGVKLKIKIITGKKLDIIPYIEKFIHSISQNIKIEVNDNNDIYFEIQKFEDIMKYANSLMNRYYKT